MSPSDNAAVPREWFINVDSAYPMISEAHETRIFKGTHVIEYLAYEAAIYESNARLDELIDRTTERDAITVERDQLLQDRANLLNEVEILNARIKELENINCEYRTLYKKGRRNRIEREGGY